MKIKLTSVMVNDLAKAIQFYTEMLGFVKKADLPAGGGRWVTVVSPEGPDDLELLLEPTGFPPSVTFQKALYDAHIPLTILFSSDLQKEYERLEARGVVFPMKPTKMEGGPSYAIFDDTCGNLIMIASSPDAG
jgi:predicted enzyme related to lactoylglutathione lyase